MFKMRFTAVYLITTLIFFCFVGGCQNRIKESASHDAAEHADGYDKRLSDLIGYELSDPIQTRVQDVYGKGALMRVLAGADLDAANEILKQTAQWFDSPHPHGRSLDGEPDFSAAVLCRAYYLLYGNDNLYPETKKAIERFFTEYDYKSVYPSENHYLLFRSSRYLMASILRDPVKGSVGIRFNAYRDEAVALEIEDEYWLKDFLTYRAKRGWGEFDSTTYIIADWECLINLYDFSPNEQIKKLAKINMDQILLGMALNSVDGIYGGAHGRSSIKANSSFDHSTSNCYGLNYLYFGNCSRKGLRCMTVYGSDYRAPAAVVKFANSKHPAYVNLERKHLHNAVDARPYKPLEGSIRKYTYVTPGYILGCVQFQDGYPQGHESAWYANHCQLHWDISFVGGNKSLRIFTNHPSDESDKNMATYWTGSEGHFFQHENAILALYDIPANMHYQLIHAYFPRKLFDEIIEKDGWIFAKAGNTAVGLKFSSPYQWTKEGSYADIEITSEGSRHAVVCEAQTLDGITFAEFMNELLHNDVSFDAKTMELRYSSKAAGVLAIDTKGKRERNGKAEDLNYPSFGSPYAYSKWDSGVVVLNFDGEKIVWDSNE